MPKNDHVFRLKCDDEVLAVAANGYLPAKGTVVVPLPLSTKELD